MIVASDILKVASNNNIVAASCSIVLQKNVMILLNSRSKVSVIVIITKCVQLFSLIVNVLITSE